MHRTIKSFVMRAGRVSSRQQWGLDACLATYQLPPPGTSWNLTEIFGREADTVVEIGFGMGASLVSMAKAAPELNFVGIEVHRAGIGSVLASLHDEGLQNVRVAPFDAVAVFQSCIPADSLAGVQLFFPDPWPKKRHHKRRLVQPEWLNQVIPKLKIGGFLHCATDWEEYAHHMMTVLSADPRLSNTDLNKGFIPKPERRPLTKFEQRGTRLGHGIWDLLFVRLA